MNMKIVGLSVASFVVVTIIAMVIIPFSSPGSVEDGWHYDDYRSAENVSSASGSLEIVTIDGTDYLHAKNVGSGTITYTDSSVESVTVKKATLDVFFLYGQSNASYRNGDITKVDDAPGYGVAYYFGYADAYGPSAALNDTGFDVDECDMYSLYDSSGTLRVGGILPDLAYEYHQITGHKIYLIDGAVGNKSILTFDPPSGFMWTYGDSILTAGLAEIDTDLYDYTCKYYMWIQGEADSSRDVAVYKSQFMEMHEALLNGDMAGVHFQKCFISKVRAANGVNSSVAQLELAEEHPDTISIVSTAADSFTVSNGLMGSDDLHYSQLGNNIIGTEFGRALGATINPGAAELSKFSDLMAAIPALVIVALIASIAVVVIRSRAE